MLQPTEKGCFLCFDIQEGYTFRKELVLMVPPSRNDSTDNVNVHKEVLLADPPTKTERFI
jgi:hypothetical protein